VEGVRAFRLARICLRRRKRLPKSLTPSAERQTMPVDARRGASQSDELQAAHTGGLFFFAPAVPLIWINGRRSEEHTVRVTPRMGCPLCCFPFDLRPPLSQTALFFLTLCGSFDLDQRSDLPGVDRGDASYEASFFLPRLT